MGGFRDAKVGPVGKWASIGALLGLAFAGLACAVHFAQFRPSASPLQNEVLFFGEIQTYLLVALFGLAEGTLFGAVKGMFASVGVESSTEKLRQAAR